MAPFLNPAVTSFLLIQNFNGIEFQKATRNACIFSKNVTKKMKKGLTGIFLKI